MTHLHLERRTVGIAMVVLAVGVTYASIPGSDGAIHGCYAAGGQLRVIDTDAGQSCHLALPLLVARVLADHPHDSAPADDLALVTYFFD